MSQPAAGKYYIVNRETTADGTSLAITFNGESELLTVTELGSQPTQVVRPSLTSKFTLIILPIVDHQRL